MYLEKLELQGFKSFAAKTSLEFRHGITAIVGPNGSGKSNIADGIRWVLGEQSLKLIRGKRAEDVIFAGSDRKTKLGAAEVSLYLNNEDGAAPVDFSELVITRRVYRDGSGEYLVNKRPVRLQDIHMLLARANFGQRTYSVIGQGMVDSILMTSPQERKHFFDEAAGVRQYQLKREQTVVKLEHTRENLRQAEVLLQEIEPRLRSLTRQVRRLERRSEIEQRLTSLQVTFYRGTLQDLRRQLNAAQARAGGLEAEQKKHAATVGDLNDRLSAIEREQSRSEAFSALQKEFDRLQGEKSMLLAEEAVLKGQRDVAFSQRGQSNIVWLEKQFSSINQQIRDFEQELKELERPRSQERTRVNELEAQERRSHEQLAKIEASIQKASASLEQGSVTLPEVREELKGFITYEQAFLAELREATDPESLVELRKRGEELERRTNRLAERLNRVGMAVDIPRLSDLQKGFGQALREREEVMRQLNELTLSSRILDEKDRFLSTNLQRLRNEHDRLGRELERARVETEEDAVATMNEQAGVLRKKINAVDSDLGRITEKMQAFNRAETEKRNELFRIQRELRAAQDRLNEVSTGANEVRVEVARLETRHQDVERETREEVKEEAWREIFEGTEPTSPPTPEQNEEIMKVKHQLSLIGGIDESVEQEYRQTDERYTFLKTQYDDLVKASEQLERGIEELDATIKERFDDAFAKINEQFSEYFRVLFRGGSAKLILVREEIVEEEAEEEEGEDEDEEDEETPSPKKGQRGSGEKVITGIEIQATPPGKRVKGLSMLSGGERALTSIALICAIISNNPMPFAVLDEVDAALDEANSQRFAAILEKLSRKTQFVMITHNRATMEKANILYGVTMGDDGVSRLLSVKLEEAEHVIKRYGNR